MRASLRFNVLMAGSLLMLIACDSRTSSFPTSPESSVPTAPPVPPAPPGPIVPRVPQGEIAVVLLQPEGDATLRAERCYPDEPIYCNRDVRLQFDVQIDQDVAGAHISTYFYDGMEECAFGGTDPQDMRANTVATFTVNMLNFTDLDDSFLCPLPQSTTRILVELWMLRRNSPLLTRELPHRYTFVVR